MTAVSDAADERLAALALATGERNLGLTWPNPSVGAVLVAPGGEGRILAAAATRPGGRPHAERALLDEVGEAARGATLYVSLEPCSHHGRTPPCADAIVAAGVARVVAPIADVDPRVAGLGFARLRAAGVAVSVGPGAERARRAHRGHFARVRLGRPFVTVKLAQTPDGFAASCAPERLMITGEVAAGLVHLARAHADAVLVGVGTVLADDPRLDVRLPGLEGRRPVRVVVDTRLRLPLPAEVVRSAGRQPTWVVCGPDAAPDGEARLRALGLEVVRAAADRTGRVDLADALRLLGERGLTRVFCEGGPALADALADADLVDEVMLLTGARALGAAGLPALGPALAARLGSTLEPVRSARLGSDASASFERTKACSLGS